MERNFNQPVFMGDKLIVFDDQGPVATEPPLLLCSPQSHRNTKEDLVSLSGSATPALSAST